MSKPLFVVPVADLERGPKSVTWSIPEAWLRDALAKTEATPEGGGELTLELSKSGRDVMVRGRAELRVEMACVVTLDPLSFALAPEIFLLLSPAPGEGARAHARRSAAAGPKASAEKGRKSADRGGKPGKATAERALGRSRGHAEAWAEDAELQPETAARDTFDGEKVVLDDFVREFIVLELPMYPRRSDLPSGESAAIAPPSPPADAPAAVDPRLLPLAAIASRLREQKKE